MRQRIRDARERRDCQKVVPNARDHCEQSKEYFDPSDLGDVTYARPSDGVSGVKDLNGNPIKATFEAFPRAKILAAVMKFIPEHIKPAQKWRRKSKANKKARHIPAPAHVWSTGHFGFFTSQDARWRKPHPRSKGESRNKLLLFDVKAEKPEHQARRGHPTLRYRRSAGRRRRSRIISCLTKGIEKGNEGDRSAALIVPCL
jgi:hypothetical protein